MAYADPEDQRRNARKHYQDHAAEYKQRAMATKKQNRIDNKAKLIEYLLAHPCVDCGETDLVVLDFDHVRGTKIKEIGRLVAGGSFWKKIAEEIEKCEVVCANCHRRRTARRHGGWYKAGFGQVAKQADALDSSPSVI